jgi:glycogen operon protein
VACHDGFPLHDLVTYARKHNEANGEANRDGNDHEHSANWGVEGPSRDPEIAARRATVARSMLTTLAVSLGTPMLCAGDELGRTQGGNNNAYCQDNPVSWLDWEGADAATLGFFRRALALRRAAPLRRRSFFTGSPGPDGRKDLQWRRPDGAEPGLHDWGDPRTQALGLLLAGATGALDEQGRPLTGEDLLVLLNASAQAVRFALPAGAWVRVLDSADAAAEEAPAEAQVEVAAHAVVVLRASA